ncbi:hypothetical protein B0H13DRAFT_1882907 [Mycena leptocephala]|nr:hypothetical protein B0H13DRAFT_1882907 [Mycena leptocephala]
MAEIALGDYTAGQAHANEACKFARISTDLYREAQTMHIEAHHISVQQGRDLVGLCGMSGGDLDHAIQASQAEVHKLKSEYVDARNIHTQIIRDAGVGEDPFKRGFSLLNAIEIDVLMGVPKDVQRNLDAANSIINRRGL